MNDRSKQRLAIRIKAVRLRKGMTQTNVAGKADISPNYYARLERGEVKPSVEVIEKITKALGVKSSDILPF